MDLDRWGRSPIANTISDLHPSNMFFSQIVEIVKVDWKIMF